MSADKFLTKDEQVELLRSGVDKWNAYRSSNPSFLPNLSGVDFGQVDLRQADLSGVDLRCARLSGSDLNRANLSDADLSDCDLTNVDCGYVDFSSSNCSGVSGSYMNLFNANASGANFSGADLSSSNLGGVDFYAACLMGANLSYADLGEVGFEYADLNDVDLSYSELNGTKFKDALLAGANFSGASLFQVIFSDVDLSGVANLDQTEHVAPSTIGIDSVFKSGFAISDIFLERCGVPRQLIDFLPSFKELPIQYYSCFISYSQKDEAFTKRLYEGLKSENIRVWYAPEEMKAGRTIYDQIDRAIRMHDKLLLVLSEASMNSQWVKTEIRKARRKEQQTGRRVLFPISIVDYEAVQCWECFDAGSGSDMADDIREYYIPDFSNWKDHDVFQVEFKKLVAALQESEEE